MCCSGKQKQKNTEKPQEPLQPSEPKEHKDPSQFQNQFVQPNPEPPEEIQVEKVVPKQEEVRAENLMQDTQKINHPIIENQEQVQADKQFKEYLLGEKLTYKKILERQEKEFNTEPKKYSMMGFSDKQQDFYGPKIIKVPEQNVNKNENIFGNEIVEIRHHLMNKKFIYKGIHKICAFEAEIEEKQYFLKTIYGVKQDKSIIALQKIKQLQGQKKIERKNIIAYQIQNLAVENLCNLHLISTMESYNLYTLADSDRILFDNRKEVAKQVISMLPTERSDDLIMSKLLYIKPQNFLISDQEGHLQVKLSDWQFYVPEFEEIIALKDVQSNYPVGYGTGPDKIWSQSLQGKMLMILLFFQLNLSITEKIGNLDGRGQLQMQQSQNKVLDVLDENFINSKELDQYINNKIQSHFSHLRHKYELVWKNLKEKNLNGFKQSLEEL